MLVTAHDFAFTGVPQQVPAGWITIRMVNAGQELHMLGIGRVPDGHTLGDVFDAMKNNRPEPSLEDWGGPNAVSPGDTATITMFFTQGQYGIACAVESADGKVHLAKGMIGQFEVVAASDTLETHSEGAQISLSDYRINIGGPPLLAGTSTVRVVNDGQRVHDLEILRILPGHTAEEALTWFEHPAKGAPTARALGGVVGIHPGQEALVTVTLTPGTYLFLCWIPDDAGQPHFRRGMQQLVTIR